MFKNDSIFGLDIGYEALKLVELKKKRGGIFLVGSVEVPLTERILEKDSFKNKAHTATLIKDACRKALPSAIKATKIASALPETFVFSKTIQMPKMSEGEYAKAIPIEAAQFLPIPIEEVYIDHQVLIAHPEDALVDILIAASPRKLVDDYLEMTKLAGFELAALETKPIAVGRAIKSSMPLDGSLIVEIGTEISRISIWDNNSIRLSTTVATGKNQIVENLRAIGHNETADKISIKENEFPDLSQTLQSISDEIINAIKYHQNRDYKPKPVKKILLCGTGAKISGIDAYISKETKIAAEIVKPNLKGGASLGTEFITAFGLALRNEYE
ncbi:MAG: pilus assembly protein PilM [Patescibacteria group bacterium]|nr:pilus assembly protein PilM [Patescibacteria group bacterium]